MRQYDSSSVMLRILLGWTLVATIITPIGAKALSKHLGNPGAEGVETNLISLLTGQARESQYLRQAYALLDEVQSSPTCNQLAAYQLLTSCKSLEVGPDGTETPVLLERVKNLYAARLAVCELNSAHASIPTQCTGIMSISLAERADGEQPRLNRSWFGRDYPGVELLQLCVKALHARSTSWTSYSNNRAQAITMCHAIRDYMEREHTAETHRKLVKVVSKMADETSEVSRVLSETHQRHVATHLEVQDLFESFMANVHSDIELFAQKGVEVVDILSDVKLSTALFQADIQALSSSVKNVSNDVDKVRRGVTNILQPVIEASSEISSHLVDMRDFMELAKPFLSKGTEVAHLVNDGWQQIQATHSAMVKIVPQAASLIILALIGVCIGIRKRRITLAVLSFVNGRLALRQIRSMLSGSVTHIYNFCANLPQWIRANEDILAVSGFIILAFAFAVISCFWVDSIKQARLKLAIKERDTTQRRIRRHDQDRNLAVDLALPRYRGDTGRDRFKRAGTAPPQYIKSEWV